MAWLDDASDNVDTWIILKNKLKKLKKISNKLKWIYEKIYNTDQDLISLWFSHQVGSLSLLKFILPLQVLNFITFILNFEDFGQ